MTLWWSHREGEDSAGLKGARDEKWWEFKNGRGRAPSVSASVSVCCVSLHGYRSSWTASFELSQSTQKLASLASSKTEPLNLTLVGTCRNQTPSCPNNKCDYLCSWAFHTRHTSASHWKQFSSPWFTSLTIQWPLPWAMHEAITSAMDNQKFLVSNRCSQLSSHGCR